MGYREFNTRGTRSRQSLHIRLWDWLTHLHGEYRLGWLAVFLAALWTANHYLFRTAFFGGGIGGAPQPSIQTVENGDAFRELIATSDDELVAAAVSVAGLGETLLFFPKDSTPDKQLKASQARALDRFLAAYPRLADRLADALLAGYRIERAKMMTHIEDQSSAEARRALQFIHGAPRVGDLFPDFQSSGELLAQLENPHLVFFGEETDGLGYLALAFVPQWSVHPFGAVLHGDRILWTGTQPAYQAHIPPVDSGTDSPKEPLADARLLPDYRGPRP